MSSAAAAEKRSLQYYYGNYYYGYNTNNNRHPGGGHYYSSYGGYSKANPPPYGYYDEVSGDGRYYNNPSSSQFAYSDENYIDPEDVDGSATVNPDRHVDNAGDEEPLIASSSEEGGTMKTEDLLGDSREGYRNDGTFLHDADHDSEYAGQNGTAFLFEDQINGATPTVDDISPLYGSSAAMVGNADVPWGSIIGASFLVQLVTLSGLALLVSGVIVRRCSRRKPAIESHREGSPTPQLHSPTTCATGYLLGLGLLASGVVYRPGLASSSRRTDAITQNPPRGVIGLSRRWTHGVIPGFATGALISTVVFLLIPEAFELLHSSSEDIDNTGSDHRFLQEDHDHSSGTAWKFGVSFLCGFVIPLLLSSCFPARGGAQREETSSVEESQQPSFQMIQELINNSLIQTDSDSDEVENDDSTAVSSFARKVRSDLTTVEEVEDGYSLSPEDAIQTSSEIRITEKPFTAAAAVPPVALGSVGNRSLAASILLGDFLHNFCDGVFVGTAFLLCDSALGWTVVVATVYHELAQEIADFTILITHCNFSIGGALLANFLAGFSVVIGAVLVAWMEFSRPSVGLILALSSGVYVHIGAAECVPMIDKDKTILALLSFLLGAVPIGLVSLNHTHC